MKSKRQRIDFTCGCLFSPHRFLLFRMAYGSGSAGAAAAPVGSFSRSAIANLLDDDGYNDRQEYSADDYRGQIVFQKFDHILSLTFFKHWQRPFARPSLRLFAAELKDIGIRPKR
jgi:hypothetical protein